MEPQQRLKEQVDQRSTQAGQQVNTVADDVRTVAGELRNQGKDKPAQYAEQAAERVQSVGQWLERSDGDQILNDVEGFARRKPWAVAAGGLVLGLAASRFLKASSSERYRASVSNGSVSNGSNGVTPPVQPDRDSAAASSAAASSPARRARWSQANPRMTAPDNGLTDRSTGELLKSSRTRRRLLRQAGDRPDEGRARRKGEARRGSVPGCSARAGLFGIGAFLCADGLLHRAAGRVRCRSGLAALIVAAVYAVIAGRACDDGTAEGQRGDPGRTRADDRKREGGRAMGQDPSQIRK